MSADGIAFLSEAGRVLGESLDLPGTFGRVARLCVPALGQVAIFDLIEHGDVRRVAVAAAEARLEPLAQELLHYSPHATHPIFASADSARAVLLPHISEEKLRGVAQDARHFQLLHELGFVSALLVPLVARGAVLGVLSLVRPTPNAYSAEDIGLAEELGRRAGLAVEHARLFAAEQRARRRAESAVEHTLRLLAVTQGLSGALDPAQVAHVIVHEGLIAVGAAGGAVAITNPARGVLEILAHAGYPANVMQNQLAAVPLDLPVPIAYGARTGQPVFLSSRAEWNARFSIAPLAASAHDSWAVLPLMIEGRCIGVVGTSFVGEREFPVEEREFLGGLASQCALALHRAQLFAAERSARAAAEEAVRAREEFLSIASHELRTPLTPLLLQLGAARKIAEGAIAERLDTALRQTERLGRLVTNLLDVGRIGAGRFLLEKEELDLEPLVRGVLERCAEELKRAACAVTVSTEPLRVQADQLRLEQVVLNLISNAMKYAAGAPVEVKLRREGGEAVLSVRDQGIGIELPAQQRIFERFERAVPAREYSGLGLGLYIAREIVEAHGGAISVDSRPGKGALFTVRLPLGVPTLPA